MVEIETLPPDYEPEGQNQDECWEPLSPQTTPSSTHEQRIAVVEDDTVPPYATLRIGQTTSQRRSTRRPPPQPSSFASPSSRSASVVALQQRVQLRRHLKQRLVNHPLQLVWSHWLWHLCREFWALNVTIRVAVLLIAVGALCKVVCCMTWYMWYPRTILLVLLGLGGWCYVDPRAIPRLFEQLVNALANLPHRIPETLEALEPSQLRRLALVLLYVPTLLQTRAISFLADINATGGGWRWNISIVLVMAGLSYGVRNYSRPSRAAPSYREVAQYTLLVLYGSALLCAIQNFKLLTMPSLAAPFFLSTGTLLLSSQDHDNMEWFSRMVRHSLRLTLRDVLATVGNSVQEDELLQLAMLRWIVDYWSSTTNAAADNANNSSSSGTSSSNGDATTPQTPVSDTTSTTVDNPHRPLNNNRQDLQWDELMPMLNMATDQMTTEVQSLQQPHQQPPQQSGGTAGHTGVHESSINNDPLQSLHAMLASMNIDGRAKPAVLAYKRMVHEFPPSRSWAVFVSVTRRCPTCLVVLWQLLVVSLYQSMTTTLVILFLLSPMVVVEILGIQAWIGACQQLSDSVMLCDVLDSKQGNRNATRTESTTSREAPEASQRYVASLFSSLVRVDPMIILLSGDDDNRTACASIVVPSLLLVWQNICNSVHALEVSLTAARCVHTGAVAVEFAKNVMSLAQLGVEVSQYGWMHGLGIVLKEVIFHNSRHNSPAAALADPLSSTHALYTQAARSAVHNGQTVASNLRALAAENEENRHLHHLLAPVAEFFGFMGGLFNGGKRDQDQPRQESKDHTEEADDNKRNNATEDDENEAEQTKSKEYWEGCASGAPETESQDSLDDIYQEQQKPVEPSNTGVMTAVDGDTMPEFSSRKKEKNGEGNEEAPENTGDATQYSSEAKHNIDSTESHGTATTAELPKSSTTRRIEVINTSHSEEAGSGSKLTSEESTFLMEQEVETLPAAAPAPFSQTGVAEALSPAKEPPIPNEVDAKRIEQKKDNTVLARVTSTAEEISIDNNQSEHATSLLDFDTDIQHEAGQHAVASGGELSEIMDLIAEAFERELIEETEKNEFCLKLSSNKGTDLVVGMKRTLEGLLASSADEQATLSTVSPAMQDDHQGLEQQVHTVCDATLSAAPSYDKISLEKSIDTSELLEDEGWCSIAESEASSPREAVTQALDYSDKVANAVNAREALAVPQLSENLDAEACGEDDGIPTVASAPPRKDGGEDNMWVKVGGGIAMLGAVVGGAFLAMNQGNENKKEDTTQKSRSSVQIERLDDEDVGDRWEAATESRE